MKAVSVFCGANKGAHPDYEKTAAAVGRELAGRGISVVFGAGKIGLMGVLANAVLENDGNAIGVIPHFLKKMEVCHESLTELHEVETMHQRKQKMAEISDGFLVLPGGYGTLDEFFEILTWKQLRLHQKPIGILNLNGFYDHLLLHINHMAKEGFVHTKNLELIIVEKDFVTLLQKMLSHQPAPTLDKWWVKT
jgi:hypothetical protein